MTGFRSSAKRVGYDQEEAFFHVENKRLIKKMKNEKEGGEVNNVIQFPTNRSQVRPKSGNPLKKAA